MIFLLLYILPTYLAQDQQITLPCDESCAVEKELELSLESENCSWPLTVQLDACQGHLIKLQFRPEDSIDIDLSLIDTETDQTIYATDGFKKSEDVVVYSIKNSVKLQYLFHLSTAATKFPTTPTTTTTLAPTPDPIDRCTAICDNESENGPHPLPGLEPCCLDGGAYCECTFCEIGTCYPEVHFCGEGEGFCNESNQCITVDTCNVEDCCPQLHLDTNRRLYPTPSATEDPWTICEDLCREESEAGLFPFPGVASCCEEGGLHCDCNACYDGFGCIGQHEHCREGEVFCEERRQCVALDNCDAHTCCPNLPPSYKNTGSGLSIRYSCQPDTQKHGSFDQGSGMVTELLEPNMVLSYNLQSENLHKVEINMSVPSPLAGFSAVSIGDGMYAMGFKNLNLTILNTESDNTEVAVVTINNPMEAARMDLHYDLGEHSTTMAPTTTMAPKSTAATDDKTATVYVLAINEEDFVAKFFKDPKSEFKERTWRIMTNACSDLLELKENLIHYDTAYSCRRQCYMTKNPDRGCAMLGMHLEDIPEATHCPGIVGISRIQYFRDQLTAQRKEMKETYSAGRVDIDSCTDINWTTEWLWVAIGLVVGAVLLAGAIIFCKKQGGRMRKSDMDDTTPIMDIGPEKQIPASRRHGFDIIDENDEY